MTPEQEREWKEFITSVRDDVARYRLVDPESIRLNAAILAADDDLRALRARVAELEGAIREHREAQRHMATCHDAALYRVLEGGKG